MIKLFGLSSPNVMKVMIMLEEANLGYQLHPVNIWAHEQFADEFKALNPNSKVPVIVDSEGPDGRAITVFESGAILIYLAEKVGRFIPGALHARYVTLQWLMLQMGSIGPMFGQATHFRRSGPPGSEYSLSRYVTEVKRLFDVLETRLSESVYLGGDNYSIADIASFPWVNGYHEPNGINLAELPNVARWMARIAKRAAVARVLDVWEEMQESDAEKRRQASTDGFDHLFGRGKYSRIT